MKFYNEEDLANGNYERFCQEIDELCRKAEEKAKLLRESHTPQFNTIEEVLQYYDAIPFSEWESKMMKRLGIKILRGSNIDNDTDINELGK